MPPTLFDLSDNLPQQEKLAEDLSNCRAIESSLKEAFNNIKVGDATRSPSPSDYMPLLTTGQINTAQLPSRREGCAPNIRATYRY